MKILRDLRIPYQRNPDLLSIVAARLGLASEQIGEIRVLKRSLDARQSRHLAWVYTLEVYLKHEKAARLFEPFEKLEWKGTPPLILGAGPAGLFAAWTFLEHGIRPILLERGARTHPRMLKISRYWRHGELDPDSNVCNGEGGAGTFSDGKLVTRIKSPLIPRVMQAFVDYGAPPEIAYVYNPHVGSNLIREVIKKMSDDLIARGAKLCFETRVEALDLCGKQVQGVRLADGSRVAGSGLVLACGHSAGEFFRTLADQGVLFEPKSFALGLRIEHPQSYINRWQYGEACERLGLEAAQYKWQSFWEEEKIGVYTFCMCPGGYVISSSTDPEAIVVNGMSNYHRNSPWANAALVCSVAQEKIPGTDPFKMMNFQRGIERDVYQAGRERGDPRHIPAQRVEDFLEGNPGKLTVKSSCPSGTVAADLSKLLPEWIVSHLRRALLDFDRRRRGFAHPDAILHAVESRTSSPLRMPRHPETLESLSLEGLFPCGEGPGYAGGITSAAVDGMRAALAWIEKFVRAGARLSSK
ncbi:MAG TPA: hypothetical protein DF383_01560 [Deltaproteobacteria bacterium]|nr:hypothetical protein [Deltaproteobacteria bacterium]